MDHHYQRAQETAEIIPTNLDDVEVDGSAFAFSDTWSFSTGLAWTYREGFTATAGAAFRPTPVPAQIGRTNYVDSDLLSLALGHRFAFQFGDRKLQADIGLQFWQMFTTTVHKDPTMIRDEFADRAKTLLNGQPMIEAEGLQTNNPGFPGYTFGGLVLNLSLMIGIEFN